MIENGVNRTRTSGGSVTAGLPTGEAIGNLMKLRNAHGATSAVGQTCSNLIEQLCNLPTYEQPDWVSDERQTSPWLIQYQMNRLAALTAGAN